MDVLGDDVVATGRAAEWICAPINLDIAVIQSVKEIRKLEKIRAKYGRKFLVKIKHVEAWASIEGHSSDVSVPEVLREFGVKTSNEMLDWNTQLQDARRPG